MVRKKNVKKKAVKKNKKLTLKQKQNRQIMWAIILMAAMILIILLVPLIIKNYLNKFIYLKLEFQKTQLGDLVFYSTALPVVDKYGTIVNYYTMPYNRYDPRELEKTVVVDVGEYIQFRQNQTVYISLDSEMEQCEDTNIGLINLAGFLRDFAGREVSSGTTDPVYAELNNLSYATCEYRPLNNVLIIKSGNETSIKKVNAYCYELTYDNCEIVQVSERFIWKAVEEYMKPFVRA